MTAKEQLRIEKVLYEELSFPIEKNAVLGEYRLYLGEVFIDCIPIKAVDSAGEWHFKEVLYVILHQYLSVSS